MTSEQLTIIMSITVHLHLRVVTRLMWCSCFFYTGWLHEQSYNMWTFCTRFNSRVWLYCLHELVHYLIT